MNLVIVSTNCHCSVEEILCPWLTTQNEWYNSQRQSDKGTYMINTNPLLLLEYTRQSAGLATG